MITHYAVEENIFVVIVYKVLEQRKHLHAMLKTVLKVKVNKGSRCTKKQVH